MSNHSTVISLQEIMAPETEELGRKKLSPSNTPINHSDSQSQPHQHRYYRDCWPTGMKGEVKSQNCGQIPYLETPKSELRVYVKSTELTK